MWLGPCAMCHGQAARRWARRRRRGGGSHRYHIVPLGRVPPPATPWGGPVAEARGRRVAGRLGGHVTVLESRTTERQARHTSMQARPATESYWVLTSYHVPIQLTSGGTNNFPSVRVEGHQSHPVRALEQWCPDLPKVSAALKFSARCARSCKLYSIVQAAVWYKLLVLRYSCIQLYLVKRDSAYVGLSVGRWGGSGSRSGRCGEMESWAHAPTPETERVQGCPDRETSVSRVV